MNEVAIPSVSLLQGFEYAPASRTDVTIGWRKLGWLPKVELDAERKAQATVKRAQVKEKNNAS